MDLAVDDTRFDTRWLLEAGRGIEPGSATAVNGAAARFTFTVPRWGRRAARLGRAGAARPLAAGRGPGQRRPARPGLLPVTRRRSAPGWCSAGCRTGSASTAARVPGEGTEFAGVREYVPGDRQRAINWPASTRLGRLQVNTFAAERSQDMVLLVDATSDVGPPGELRARPGAARRGGRGARLPGRPGPGGRDHATSGAARTGSPRRSAAARSTRSSHVLLARTPAARAARCSAACRAPRCRLARWWSRSRPLLDGRFVETLRDMRERGFAPDRGGRAEHRPASPAHVQPTR